jgi:hypothetical protein
MVGRAPLEDDEWEESWDLLGDDADDADDADDDDLEASLAGDSGPGCSRSERGFGAEDFGCPDMEEPP